MKIAGIIAEYNPFHNGHKYHIEQTRKLTGADYIIVVMSGNFTQRGIPAIMDKYLRAHISLENGADLVLELPHCYACGSAEYFADGDWGNYEITFIGHSKGGAEAAANAVATNRNAILFNPAATALNEYGLNANTYSADMTVYVVKGEPLNALNSLLGAKAIDNYETLPFYSWNPIKNHSMEAVKNGVKGR